MEKLGRFTLVILISTVMTILGGFVFAKLWRWFIVPTFDFNELRLIEAIGVMFVIGFVRAKKSKDSKDEDFWDDFGKLLSFNISLLITSLFFGWVFSLFI